MNEELTIKNEQLPVQEHLVMMDFFLGEDQFHYRYVENSTEIYDEDFEIITCFYRRLGTVEVNLFCDGYRRGLKLGEKAGAISKSREIIKALGL